MFLTVDIFGFDLTVILTWILLLAALAFLMFVIAYLFKGFVVVLLISFLFIVFMAAVPFIPKEPVEPYNLDNEAIKKCVDEGRLCPELLEDKVLIETRFED